MSRRPDKTLYGFGRVVGRYIGVILRLSSTCLGFSALKVLPQGFGGPGFAFGGPGGVGGFSPCPAGASWPLIGIFFHKSEPTLFKRRLHAIPAYGSFRPAFRPARPMISNDRLANKANPVAAVAQW